MKKEIADKWIEALKSGKYKQHTNSLRVKDMYCCLGVLCDISNVSKWTNRDFIFNNREFLYYYDDNGGFPSPNVINWSELKDWMYFSRMNDVERKSFNEIADYIEANWENI